MAKKREDISESLARRGRPEMWANVQEAALLSGMSSTVFVEWLDTPAARGFPPINPHNKKRPITAILNFWKLDTLRELAPQAYFELVQGYLPLQLLENFETQEEFDLKREYADLVVQFRDWKGKPGAIYESTGRAAAVLEPGAEWTEVERWPVARDSRAMTQRGLVREYGELPRLPDWLFMYPPKRGKRRRHARREPVALFRE